MTHRPSDDYDFNKRTNVKSCPQSIVSAPVETGLVAMHAVLHIQ